MENFSIFSKEFQADTFLPSKHALNIKQSDEDISIKNNMSPQLEWKGIPNSTKSLALTLFDPDAPTGSGFWHWVVINISADIKEFAEDAGNPSNAKLPHGAIQLLNDYGTRGYGGCAPPKGHKPHRYIFRLHALNVEKIDIDANATNAIARFHIHQNEIDSTTITGLYEVK